MKSEEARYGNQGLNDGRYSCGYNQAFCSESHFHHHLSCLGISLEGAHRLSSDPALFTPAPNLGILLDQVKRIIYSHSL